MAAGGIENLKNFVALTIGDRSRDIYLGVTHREAEREYFMRLEPHEQQKPIW